MGKQRKYSPEFKLFIVKKRLVDSMSFAEILRRYFPYLKGTSSDSAIRKWVKIYQNEGKEALMEERRGVHLNPKKVKLKKVEKKYLEELLSENETLRAENKFLKKLQALDLAQSVKKSK